MPKICWLRDNKKELYEKTDKFILWDGLAGYLLGCSPFVTYSGANRTLLFDINTEDWSDTLLEASGIERSLLPGCVPGGEIAGEVCPKAASELGLQSGVKVVAGGHDQCCNSLGAGIAAAGRAVDGIGTFECIAPVYDYIPEPETMLNIGLNVEHHVIQGLYVSFLYNQAGSLVRWFRDTFASDLKENPKVYEILTAEMPESPAGLFVLPYFEPTGSPGFISDASGVITGLRTDTKRGEILKAIMECITFYFAESIDSLDCLGINPSEYIATGGGAKSDQWLQIKADIMGVPYIRPGSTECGIIGAAILAGTAAGDFSTPEEGIKAMVSYEKTFEPDKTLHEIYRNRFDEYKKLYPRLKEIL